ncbi:MAG: DUF4142 domain-containing protein [Taibaiella sp.]|nr:DUF4142 domain-containing protein [Taibaiella sp.]
MKKYLFTVAALLVVLTCIHAQQRNTTRNASGNQQQDREFVQKATAAGKSEVRLGELGQLRGTHAMVREYGMMMVKDHQMANKELEELVMQKGYADMPGIADAADDEAYEQLSKKKGDAFDKAFAQQMVKDHEKVIRLFTMQAENGKDEALKNWAAQKLPVLKEHLEHAKRLQETVKQQK